MYEILCGNLLRQQSDLLVRSMVNYFFLCAKGQRNGLSQVFQGLCISGGIHLSSILQFGNADLK